MNNNTKARIRRLHKAKKLKFVGSTRKRGKVACLTYGGKERIS